MKGAQGEKVEAVQKPRKFSTGAAHHQDGGMAQACGPTSRDMSGAKLLLPSHSCSGTGTRFYSYSYRPIVLD